MPQPMLVIILHVKHPTYFHLLCFCMAFRNENNFSKNQIYPITVGTYITSKKAKFTPGTYIIS